MHKFVPSLPQEKYCQDNNDHRAGDYYQRQY